MYEESKKQLVKIAAMMYEKGMVNTYEGNISIKDGEHVLITPSGICKGMLCEDMICVTDMQGTQVEGTMKPSSEIRLHLGAYRYRHDIGGVVHSHSPFATAFALAHKPIESKGYSELPLLFGSVPLAEYGAPSTDEIFEGVKPLIPHYDVILLANHGIMSVGKDVQEAFFKIEAAESIAKTLLYSRLLGGEVELPAHRLSELEEIRRRK